MPGIFSFFFKQKLHIWFFYAFLAFPLFYFVYKHLNIQLGYKDYGFYNNLYANWDFSGTESPYNLRLISSWLVHLLVKCGCFYDTETTFGLMNPGANKLAFFNAILVNYLSLVTTAFLLYKLVIKTVGNKFLAMLSGFFLFSGFGTIFYLLAPLTDCFSVLLFVVILDCYLKRSWWIIFFFMMAIFQREYIFICFGIISFLDYIKSREKYLLRIVFLSLLCFVAYMALRKTLFYTHRFSSQLSASASFGLIVESLKEWKAMLMQILISMNLVVIYTGLLFYKRINKLPVDKWAVYKLIVIFLVTLFIGLAGKVGNNTGRVFYLCIPLVIYFLLMEMKPLFDKGNMTAP